MRRLALRTLLGVAVCGAILVEHQKVFSTPVELRPGAQGGMQILDRHGELLYEFAGPAGGAQSPVSLENISPYLVQATIATEDADFYSNAGVNVRGLGRAVFENLAFWEYGGFLRGSGGSSITQQVVKSLGIAGDRGGRNPEAKAREILIALDLTRTHSKDEILGFYLNSVFYGSGAYGAEAAAQRYFGKSAGDLTLSEASFLAGIPNAPAVYDAFRAFDRVRSRQQDVLELMVRRGFVDADAADAAFDELIEFHSEPIAMRAPHFVNYVHDLVGSLVGDSAVRHGVRITTTLDLSLQQLGEDVLEQHLSSLEPRLGPVDGAIVAIDPRSGEILAMVGGRSFDDPLDGQVNNALALNQTGSAIKPLTYLAAFEKGWSPATIVYDQPMQLNDGQRPYTLVNFDGRYSGPVPIREALGNSLNPPAVQAVQFVGVPYAHQLAGRMGLTTLEEATDYGPAFTLGGVDVTLLDFTFAYAVLANEGEQRGMPSIATWAVVPRPLDPAAVLRVEDSSGQALWGYEQKAERIAPASAAYLVTNVLSDDSARIRTYGPNSLLNLPGRQAAVKTGLSDGPRDAWTLGYTPQLVTGVWTGRKDNDELRDASSVQVASPIWHAFMERALAGEPAMPFDVPSDIVWASICRATGLPPARGCAKVVTEVFVAGQPGLTTAQAPVPAAPAPAALQSIPPGPTKAAPNVGAAPKGSAKKNASGPSKGRR